MNKNDSADVSQKSQRLDDEKTFFEKNKKPIKAAFYVICAFILYEGGKKLYAWKNHDNAEIDTVLAQRFKGVSGSEGTPPTDSQKTPPPAVPPQDYISHSASSPQNGSNGVDEGVMLEDAVNEHGAKVVNIPMRIARDYDRAHVLVNAILYGSEKEKEAVYALALQEQRVEEAKLNSQRIYSQRLDVQLENEKKQKELERVKRGDAEIDLKPLTPTQKLAMEVVIVEQYQDTDTSVSSSARVRFIPSDYVTTVTKGWQFRGYRIENMDDKNNCLTVSYLDQINTEYCLGD